VCVLEVHVGPFDPSGSGGGGEYALLSPGASRKRKRIVDEDADSAAGADDEDEEDEEERARYERRNGTPLAGLSQELREVYALLQRGTARGRLLAEQYRSPTDAFEPICPRITKEDCVRFRRSVLSANTSTSTGGTGGTGPAPPPEPNVGPCSCVHFRPLIRPHTDPALGHCSYLNTCYSEPTYAHSPSIPPFSGGGGGGGSGPSSSGMVMPFGHGHGHGHGLGHGQNPRGAVSLPSGLGAGGRGKEKAPCRYLHFEVDWDPEDAAREAASSRTAARERADAPGIARPPYKLGIGLGPDGRDMKVVCLSSTLLTIKNQKVKQPWAKLPPQWINCDLRRFDYSVLGKFHVIMADPPWDIHMSVSLPLPFSHAPASLVYA
jgi:mRNA (2'-O-methyladenosine-N6-)-methyltransferase